MEEADARLQEVIASLLIEHGGNHEPALRQTFACLHNSGLYEARSLAEQDQRGQQVLAVFRSFPFRAPAVGTGAEETQAPPPSYNSLVREPEEAGEIIPAQGDPENVGEDGGGHSAPEALPPPIPEEPQEEDRVLAAGPEISHQGGGEGGRGGGEVLNFQNPPAEGAGVASTQQQQQGRSGPEGFSAGGSEAAVAAAAASVAAAPAEEESLPLTSGGVEEAKSGEWGEPREEPGGVGGPEAGGEGKRRGGHGADEEIEGATKEAARGVAFEENKVPGTAAALALNGLGGTYFAGNGDVATAGGGGSGGSAAVLGGVRGSPVGDPESTPRQNNQQGADQHARRYLQTNGGGTVGSVYTPNDHVAAATQVGVEGLAAAAAPTAIGEENIMEVPTPTASSAAAASASPAAAPVRTTVTEPHLKTAGQPLTHTNRAESPSGMSKDLEDKLKALKLRRKHRFVVMRIDGTEVVAETAAAPAEGPGELRSALPYSDCRYAVYDQELVTADGRKANKLFFFSWIPHNATPHNKMAYSHGKTTVRQRMEGLYDVAASSFEDIEVALGLVDEDEEDSDIDF